MKKYTVEFSEYDCIKDTRKTEQYTGIMADTYDDALRIAIGKLWASETINPFKATAAFVTWHKQTSKRFNNNPERWYFKSDLFAFI